VRVVDLDEIRLEKHLHLVHVIIVALLAQEPAKPQS